MLLLLTLPHEALLTVISCLTVTAGRLLNGMGVGAGTLVSPLYIAEISPAHERNMLMSAYQVLVQLGALFGFWAAFFAQISLSDTSALQWQLPVALQLFAGAFLLVGTLIVPESPQYLASKGQHEAMQFSLAWLRRTSLSDPRLIAESLSISSDLERRQKLPKTSLIYELRKKDVRYRLMVGVGIMIAQNMVGLNALNYFAPVIFQSAGFTSSAASLFLSGVFGVVKLLSSLAYMFKCVHIKGNRFWLLLGSAVCGISMFVLAYCIASTPSSSNNSTSTTAVGVISVLSVYLFAFSFGLSLGPISWNICAEIFPLHLNATCCAITVCTQWLFQLLIAAITPPLIAQVGWVTYLIYGGFCVVTLAWVAACVPETKGVAMGRAMDELFGAEVKNEDEEEAVEEFMGVDERTGLLGRDRRMSYTSI